MLHPLLRTATDENLSYFQRHPILWQAYEDLTEFSKAQAVPAFVMSVGAFIMAVIYGQVTSIWSGVLFIFYSLVAGLLFYALIAILRAPFIVIGMHHRQIANLNQRVMDVENRPLPAPALPAPPATPNLKLRMASILDVKIEISHQLFVSGGDQILKECGGQRQSAMGKAAVLEFVNEPVAGSVAEIKAAKAILSYHEIDGERRLDVDSGVWLGLSTPYVSFEVGHSEKLIVALQFSGRGRPMTYEYNREPEADGGLGTNLAPIKRKLEGAAYRIKVQIVNRVNVQKRGIDTAGEGELIGEYFFRLTTSPFSLIADDATN